jgi:dihydroneopterin aldolase
MLATIQLRQMRFHARHGVLPEEAVLGQLWIVDLELVVDIAQAAASDDLAHTVNYADVYSLCQDIMVNERFALIEALANHILSSVLSAHPRVKTATITIHKPQAPIPGVHDGVSLTTSLSRA